MRDRQLGVLNLSSATALSPIRPAPVNAASLDTRLPRKLRDGLFGIVDHFLQMSKLPTKGISQFGKHAVEFLRVIEANRLATEQSNAFLQRGEGHGPITMPQFGPYVRYHTYLRSP